MKIVILDGFAENPGDLSWAALESVGELTVYDRTPPDLILPRMEGAVCVLTNKTMLTAATIEACPALRYIGLLSTGCNVVDIGAAAARNIPVCNIPGYSTASVAQMTFALLLEICQNVGLHAESVRSGEWETSPDFCYWKKPLIELDKKVMGIIGYGSIGRAVAKIARSFGMRVVFYNPTEKETDDPLCRQVSLPDLFRLSDVVSLHCPLKEENRHLICRESIENMKDGVIILNTARGPLIHEADLAQALNTGKVYAAAVDVVSQEPILPDNPLLHAQNCFITPHIAWAPKESRQRLMNIAVENVRAFLRGEAQNVVNR